MTDAEQLPLQTREEFMEWLRNNRDSESLWGAYLAGVDHGENAQHAKSYKIGFDKGWESGRHPLNNLPRPN